jgi:hypothetical protein
LVTKIPDQPPKRIILSLDGHLKRHFKTRTSHGLPMGSAQAALLGGDAAVGVHQQVELVVCSMTTCNYPGAPRHRADELEA